MIRHPYPEEVEAVRALFDDEVRAGKMLPRSAESIFAQLHDWLVAEENGQIVGCVSLVYFNGSLCEVRSLAVHPTYRGSGLGRQLVEAALDMAQAHSFRRDFVANFPEKVWRDCAPCPFRHACDEVALIYDLVPVGELV
jgi:amino-acid N-acetyltransferase